jgi:hypothetical protein
MILVTVFADASNATAMYSSYTKPSALAEAFRVMHAKLDALGVLPLTKEDLVLVLKNPFVEAGSGVLDFAKKKLGFDDDALMQVAEDVALGCLEISCKVCPTIQCNEQGSKSERF